MQFYSRIKNFSLTAVIGCVALLSVGPLTAQQPVAPTATLEVAPATIVDAQPNYVTPDFFYHHARARVFLPQELIGSQL